MKYQLIAPVVKEYSATQQILNNRNIYDIESYLNTTDDVINSYMEFCDMHPASVHLGKTIEENKNCIVIVDSDCDGFTSAALLINYLYDIAPKWVEEHLEWFMHEGKQHGLNDCVDIIIDAGSYDLVICPDSSSNDYEEHKRLFEEYGIPVIVLDHHEAEKISEHAYIINNQLCDYPNKEMSGVGVVWQFCRFLDKEWGYHYADNYLDLVALGMDADMMSLTSLETKHLINKGFRPENIRNPFITAIADKNSYSLGGKITPIGAAFYIAPFVNAIVRSGTEDEKEQVFRSMLKHKAFEIIPSNKRGHKPGETEKLYEQAMRTVTNVKNRQTRAQDAGMALLEGLIKSNDMMEHKVLLFLLNPGQIDKNIAGLTANKIMAKYQRPCCILTRVEEITDEYIIQASMNTKTGETSTPHKIDEIPLSSGKGVAYDAFVWGSGVEKKVSYQGSARGCDKVGVTEFKDICEQTGVIMYAEGHQGAFGLGIEEHLIEDFLQKTDELLVDMPDEPIYYVDYIYEGQAVEPQHIIDIADLDNLWGKDVDEPLVAVKGLKVTRDMITLMSPDKKPTLKITLSNKVCLIKFGSSQEEYECLCPKTDYEVKELDIVGTCNKNEWNGWVTGSNNIKFFNFIICFWT